MAVEKAPVWTFPTNPKRLGRWYGKGPADRSPVGPGPAAARRVSSAMVPVRRSAGRGTWKRTASCERKTDRSATRRFSRSRTVRCARERGGRPDPTSLDPACHPVLVSMVRGKGFPRRAPAGSRTRRVTKEKTKTVPVGAWARPGRKESGRARGPCGGSWGTVRRTGPGSGSSDHSSEPSVSAGAFALRRRETAMRAAPPPSTTTAASAISAMPAPVWARVLR